MQLLELTAKEYFKLFLLKNEVLEYYSLEEKWPKNMLKIVLRFYDRNFIPPFHEFDKLQIFVAMRYYDFPFILLSKNVSSCYDEIGEFKKELTIGELGGFYDEYYEWEEWVNGI